MLSHNREICLQATGLTKRFGPRVAVDHLNLEVFQGEVFALLGPDGAGKTTTMRMLSGILPQDEGQARLWEFDTLRQTRQLRERLGYLPQSFGLYDDLTVAENILFYADLCRVPRAQRRQRRRSCWPSPISPLSRTAWPEAPCMSNFEVLQRIKLILTPPPKLIRLSTKLSLALNVTFISYLIADLVRC